MNAEKILFPAACGGDNQIAAFVSLSSESEIKGMIQICHGMADYFGRYEEMVDYLNRAGWHVCGMDMMGHGQTYVANKELGMPLGYFGDSDDSAMCILRDEMKLHELMKERFPDIPSWALYGHSMGSFVVRNIYITPEWNSEFDKFIFASTMGPNPAIGAALNIAKFMGAVGGKNKPSKLLDKIAFGAYNKRIDNPKTNFDWVSSDETEVAKYCEDDLAGFLFTCKGFADMAFLVKRMQTRDNYVKGSSAPAFMPYASEDPVAGYGKGAEKAADLLKAEGKNITTKNYGSYRHEIQHESVRFEYFKDIEDFINA